MGRVFAARRIALVLAVALRGFAGLPRADAAGGDQALAKRVLPRVADHPEGWAADPASKPTDGGCFTNAANAHAPTARAQASPAVAPLTCYRRTLSSVLARAGLTVTTLVSRPRALGMLGDAARGTRLTVGVREGSDKAQLIIDLIFVQPRRALIAVGFNAQSSQPLLADERTPIARSVARVPA